MRRVICWEGKETVDHRRIEPGALTWRDEPIPLHAIEEAEDPGHWGAVIVGRVTDVRREEDGAITADLEPDLPMLAPQVDLVALDYCQGDDGLIVHSARLAAVVMGTAPAWPDLMPEVPE